MFNLHYCLLCPVVYDSSAHFCLHRQERRQVNVHYFISVVFNMGHVAPQETTVTFVWDTEISLPE